MKEKSPINRGADKTPNKVIASVKNAVKETNNFLKSIERFVEAVCLLILSYAGYWTAFNVPLRNEYKYALLFAAIVVGMRGAIEFFKHINKR
jgi:hypothetical protein